MTTMKTAMRDIQKKGHEIGNIYRLAELNADQREQQKNDSILNQINDSNRVP